MKTNTANTLISAATAVGGWSIAVALAYTPALLLAFQGSIG